MLSKIIFYFLLYLLIFLNLIFISANVTYHLVFTSERVSLPNLIGKTVEEAKLELSKKRLTIAIKGVQSDNKWARGKIIFQDPSSGSKLKINRSVKVILSGGSERRIIPELEGIMLQSAGQILKDAGLSRGIVSQVHNSEYAAGKIIVQQPSPLEEVGRNTPVNFLVSQGERERKYLMPDLIGKKAKLVIEKLKKMEFRVGVVRYSYYPGLEPGIIIKQLPPHGFRIQKNNLITLELSKE